MRNLLIWGTGTIAELANFYFTNDSGYSVSGHVETDPKAGSEIGKKFGNIFSFKDAIQKFSPSNTDFFIAIGYQKTNKVREQRFNEVKSIGYTCASYISSKASIFTSNVGENTFILENNVIQPFVEIKNNVTLWSGNHIGHHSVINENAFLASHVVISGKCSIGRNSFLGVNTTVHDGVELGSYSVVGAGAIVSKNCEPHSVFNPAETNARIIKRDII